MYVACMKTNKIIKLELVNCSMHASFFEHDLAGFDTDQLIANGGTILSVIENQACVTETDLLVGDSITDENGGQAVIAEIHGETVNTDINREDRRDLLDIFNEKLIY